MELRDRLVVALDVDSLEKAKPLVEALLPWVSCFKVGLELLTSEGAPRVVEVIRRLGGQVFLDGKFHDIPNTVGSASRAVASLGVKFFDVHASSGLEAMKMAVRQRGGSALYAVTILTSLDELACRSIYGDTIQSKVTQLALDAEAAGVDGLICSPADLSFLNGHSSLARLPKMTPGIRPKWAESQDQKRALTPSEAIEAGASYLVVGRPVLNPPREMGTPAIAAQRILEEMSAAFNAS